MADCKAAFTKYLEEKQLPYHVIHDHVIGLEAGGEKMKHQQIFVDFDEKGADNAHFYCRIAEMNEEKMGASLVLCNQLNAKYRWIKFVIDEDMDACCLCDAYIDEETCGEECMHVVSEMVLVADEVYSSFMKILWG